MKFRSLIFLITVLCFCHKVVFANSKIEALSNQPLVTFHPPQIFVQTLDSGTQVYYVKDASLPIYQMSAYLHAGRIHENVTQLGLTDLLVRLWPLGGTTNIEANALIDKLESYGAQINADVMQEFIELDLKTLAKHKEETFALFFDLLQNPHFDEKKLKILKDKVLAGIEMRNEKPTTVANREFQQMIFGETNPIALKSNPQTLQLVTREAILGFYDEHVAPNQLTLVAAGPGEFLDFLYLCEKYLKDWSKPSVSGVAYPDFTLPANTPDQQWVQLPSTQSVIMMGHLGVPRTNPDKIKIAVLNSMLGGGVMGSRLGNRIRRDLGLAYDVFSQVSHHATTGVFTMAATVSSDQVFAVIDEMQSVLKGFVENDDITEEEFADTKNKILNQAIFQYEKPFDVAWQSFLFDVYGYEKGYLEKYYNTVKAMTLADAKAVLKTYFNPEQLKILVVGDKSKVKETTRLKNFRTRELDKE